jgi:hypothetical protein
MDDDTDGRRLEQDMGDDDQEDEVREYERYIEDPPRNLIIRDSDDGRGPGISAELPWEWTRRGQRAEDRDEDQRPAEEAAMDIEDTEGASAGSDEAT